VKPFFIIIIFLTFSCGYPDIDSVPDFKKVKLNKNELMDLCDNEESANNNTKICE
tara:strand:+ start:2529 stop:2693 length:165 start_codon:yes stop_codon:yes gene_type:complete